MIGDGFEHTADGQLLAESSAPSTPSDSIERSGGLDGGINEIYSKSLEDLGGTTVSLAEVNAFLEAAVSGRRVDVMDSARFSREQAEKFRASTDRIEEARQALLMKNLSQEQYQELIAVVSGTAETMSKRGLNPAGLEKFVEDAATYVK